MESDDLVAVDNQFLEEVIHLIEEMDVEISEELERKVEIYKNLKDNE